MPYSISRFLVFGVLLFTIWNCEHQPSSKSLFEKAKSLLVHGQYDECVRVLDQLRQPIENSDELKTQCQEWRVDLNAEMGRPKNLEQSTLVDEAIDRAMVGKTKFRQGDVVARFKGKDFFVIKTPTFGRGDEIGFRFDLKSGSFVGRSSKRRFTTEEDCRATEAAKKIRRLLNENEICVIAGRLKGICNLRLEFGPNTLYLEADFVLGLDINSAPISAGCDPTIKVCDGEARRKLNDIVSDLKKSGPAKVQCRRQGTQGKRKSKSKESF